MARRRTYCGYTAAVVTREYLNPADSRRMQRAKGTQVYWRTVANGRPQGGGYIYQGHHPERDSEDARLAAEAWYAVALIQAQLRGETPPAPVAEPWNRPLCAGCGFRMRCRCQKGGA